MDNLENEGSGISRNSTVQDIFNALHPIVPTEAAVLKENDVDGMGLSEMTREDLKGVGITKLGPILSIMRFIREHYGSDISGDAKGNRSVGGGGGSGSVSLGNISDISDGSDVESGQQVGGAGSGLMGRLGGLKVCKAKYRRSQIFGKNPTKTIKSYHHALNMAAYKLCEESDDPLLCDDKDTLLKLARIRVNKEKYPFKRGKSRAKGSHNSSTPTSPLILTSPSTPTFTSTPARPRKRKAEREVELQEVKLRIGEVKGEINARNERISQGNNGGATSFTGTPRLQAEIKVLRKELQTKEVRQKELKKVIKKAEQDAKRNKKGTLKQFFKEKDEVAPTSSKQDSSNSSQTPMVVLDSDGEVEGTETSSLFDTTSSSVEILKPSRITEEEEIDYSDDDDLLDVFNKGCNDGDDEDLPLMGTTCKQQPTTDENLDISSDKENGVAVLKWMDILAAQRKTGLSEGSKLVLRNGVVTESKCTLSIEQARQAIDGICQNRHMKNCERCLIFLKACSRVVSGNLIPLSELWRYATSRHEYTSDRAKRLMLQLPVALLRLSGIPGSSCIYVTRKMTNCEAYDIILQKIQEIQQSPMENHTELLKSLCLIAESEAERERIKFTAAAITNTSRRGAAKYLGISSSRKNSRVKKINKAVAKTRRLRKEMNVLMEMELIAKLGIRGIKLFHEGVAESDESESEDEGSEDEGSEDEGSEDEGSEDEGSENTTNEGSQSKQVEDIEKESQVVKQVEEKQAEEVDEEKQVEEENHVEEEKQVDEEKQVNEDKQVDEESPGEKVVEGEIDFQIELRGGLNAEGQFDTEVVEAVAGDNIDSDMSEDENKDGEIDTEVNLEGTLEECNQVEIQKVKSKYRYRYKKELAKLYIRRQSKKETRDILRKYPEIGKVMEQYAKDSDVGADKWRRTGMLTFGAEKKHEKRLTYKKLREHLMTVYNRKFSIGTVVELCAKRHKRRKASERYKGAANIKYQRAWKGWNIKLNPDSHWSRCSYKLLDKLQKNTENSLLIGRDDQAGFRLDSTFTHKQYPSLSVGKTITTHTDFLNKKSTLLQITSYNMPAGEKFEEVCFGVVKGSHVHEKSPSQHMADLTMLEMMYKDLFKGKLMEFFRVDGASDEGPSHVQY